MNNKILVTRSSMPDFEEYIEEIKDIWDSHWLTNMGPKHKKLQAQLKDYLGVENIDLFTNGHMALELSLQAMKLQGEVICQVQHGNHLCKDMVYKFTILKSCGEYACRMTSHTQQ